MALIPYTPAELLAKFRATRSAVRADVFFSAPKHKKDQELWCAAHFASGLSLVGGPYTVWISDRDEQTDTDFELEAGGNRLAFQVTEVQTPGRRRGDEYRHRAVGSWTEEDWTPGSESGPRWIRDAIEKKAKRYSQSESLNLLVYLNFPAWDQQYVDVAREAAGPASAFQSVWLLNGNALCHVKAHPSLPSIGGWLMISESLAQ